jgi:nitrite reductase/ring-hydroxylating ferredoxin subunit
MTANQRKPLTSAIFGRNLLLIAIAVESCGTGTKRCQLNPLNLQEVLYAQGVPAWVECSLHVPRFNLRTGALDAPPAKLPVRAHALQIVDGNIMIIESDEAPNLPPGLTPEGPCLTTGHASPSKGPAHDL